MRKDETRVCGYGHVLVVDKTYVINLVGLLIPSWI